MGFRDCTPKAKNKNISNMKEKVLYKGLKKTEKKDIETGYGLKA